MVLLGSWSWHMCSPAGTAGDCQPSCGFCTCRCVGSMAEQAQGAVLPPLPAPSSLRQGAARFAA